MSAPTSASLNYLAYALPGVPLALFALPLYVHVPKLYAEHLGLSLAGVGAVLLLVRLLDAVIDPWLGRWSDARGQRKQLLWLAAPFVLLGGGALLLPPAEASLLWLACALVLAYFGYSLANINYQAWGAEFPLEHGGRLRATTWREGASLLGVMLAAILPTLLAPQLPQGLARLFWLFAPLLLLTLCCATWRVPAVPVPTAIASMAGFWQLWRLPTFARLMGVYAANGIAAALPATLVLFYVGDVLQAAEWSGFFLLLYFAAAALALPGWLRLTARWGRRRAWLAGMGLAMGAFALAPLLGPGDVIWFALICVITGIALGADLTLPPALLAEHVALHGQGGACFGWWTALGKLNLALAAGLALPLLGWLGYVPGQAGAATSLAWLYGGLPLLFKLAAAILLWRAFATLAALEERKFA